MGVSMADAANSIIALNAGTSQFAKLNSQTRTDLVTATSQFEKLGVSATDTAAFMENAFKIMNMGASEAVQAQKELAMAGVELGIGADKIVKDLIRHPKSSRYTERIPLGSLKTSQHKQKPLVLRWGLYSTLLESLILSQEPQKGLLNLTLYLELNSQQLKC